MIFVDRWTGKFRGWETLDITGDPDYFLYAYQNYVDRERGCAILVSY